MAYSVKKSAVANVAGISVMLLLTGCSHDQHYKREVNGNLDYLQAAPLKELTVPAGMILPLQNGSYNLPEAGGEGAVGKQLDIRAPQQALPLVNGSRAQVQGNMGTLLITNINNSLWNQVIDILTAQHIPIAQRNDTNQQLTTDWINWNRADEDHQYRSRYQITVQSQGYQQAIIVRQTDLVHQENAVTEPSLQQSYTVQLLNQLSKGLNAQQPIHGAGVTQSGALTVQSAADDTGLPNLVVRASFDNTWQRLPAALARAGFKVSDTRRAEGNLQLSYDGLNSDGWRDLGASDPQLTTGKYKLQVGDLDNRSSLQFIDPKGHVLTQTQNDALVAVLQAAFNK